MAPALRDDEEANMNWMKRQIAVVGLAALLTAFSVGASSGTAEAAFNDEYVYATTRGVNDMDGVHPGVKLTIYPVTLAVDTVLLPFAVIAGFVTA